MAFNTLDYTPPKPLNTNGGRFDAGGMDQVLNPPKLDNVPKLDPSGFKAEPKMDAEAASGLISAGVGLATTIGSGVAEGISSRKDAAASSEVNSLYAEQERLNIAEQKRQAKIAKEAKDRDIALQEAQQTFAERYKSWVNDFNDAIEEEDRMSERAAKLSGRVLTKEDAMRITQFRKRFIKGEQ